jgi:uncharacterized protein (TIGR02271 family)
MSQTLVGLFDSLTDAHMAKHELIVEGFSEHDIAVNAHAGAASDNSMDLDGEQQGGFMRGVEKFFENLFGDARTADVGIYAEAVRRGGAVVALTVDDDARVDAARKALASVGAVDVEQRVAAWRETGFTTYDKDAPPYDADQVAREHAQIIPVVQEEIEIRKRQVDLGTVRIVSRIVETPVTEDVTLREEHATIERRPVNRVASEADFAIMQNQTVVVEQMEEQAIVTKTAHVVEEVVVGTVATDTPETVSETVRSTVVDVDRIGQVDATIAPEAYESAYQKHFQKSYAPQGLSYDTFQPAYRHGTTMATDPRYSGRGWSSIEPAARSDWEVSHPGVHWERYKGAVAHGWNLAHGNA